jgi:hypothetical protein
MRRNFINKVSKVHQYLINICEISPHTTMKLQVAREMETERSPCHCAPAKNETRYRFIIYVHTGTREKNEYIKRGANKVQKINILLWKVLRDTISFWLSFLNLLFNMHKHTEDGREREISEAQRARDMDTSMYTHMHSLLYLFFVQ